MKKKYIQPSLHAVVVRFRHLMIEVSAYYQGESEVMDGGDAKRSCEDWGDDDFGDEDPNAWNVDF